MTASTEDDGATLLGAVQRLGEADIDDAVGLSASAHWNQSADDWRLMLRLGQAWGLRARLADGAQPLVASTLVLPYTPIAAGRPFAWVSMVLVLPTFRRLGLATQLLRHALTHLERQGMVGVLDATPAGHEVYRRAGFCDSWGFARYRRPAGAPVPKAAAPAAVTLRPLRASDWPAIAALDGPAFGGDRLALLQGLAQRLPDAAWVAEAADATLRAYVLARDGREACQIGPLLATDAEVALALLHQGLAAVPAAGYGAVYVDLCDHQRHLLPALHALGFEYQRPFTRMLYDPGRVAVQAPGEPGQVVLVAGPELG